MPCPMAINNKFSYLRDFIVINGKMEVCVDFIGCHALGFGNINFQADFGCIFSYEVEGSL